jgi:hypothetical protein
MILSASHSFFLKSRPCDVLRNTNSVLLCFHFKIILYEYVSVVNSFLETLFTFLHSALECMKISLIHFLFISMEYREYELLFLWKVEYNIDKEI